MQYLITQGHYQGHRALFRAHWDDQNLVVWIDGTIDAILPQSYLTPLTPRSQKWKSKTTTIRVPECVADRVLAFARDLENNLLQFTPKP